jgi:hypothetical protein
MTSCQYKQSTEQYALFKNKVDQLKDFSQKLILTVLSNLFRTLQTQCIVQYILYTLLPLVLGLMRQTFFVNENLDSRGQNANYYLVRV